MCCRPWHTPHGHLSSLAPPESSRWRQHPRCQNLGPRDPATCTPGTVSDTRCTLMTFHFISRGLSHRQMHSFFCIHIHSVHHWEIYSVRLSYIKNKRLAISLCICKINMPFVSDIIWGHAYHCPSRDTTHARHDLCQAILYGNDSH